MTNAETLGLAESLGIGVKSHSSSIVDAQADRVRRKAEREGLIRDEQPEEPKPAKKAAKKATKKAAGTKIAPTGREAAGPGGDLGVLEKHVDRDLGTFHAKRKKFTTQEQFDRDWKDWVRSLSGDELEAIREWTGGEYGQIRAAQGFRTRDVFSNVRTRSDNLRSWAERSKVLRGAMQRSPMPAKKEVYRTFFVKDRAVFNQIANARAGDNWTMEATASFSQSRTRSLRFGRPGDTNIQLRVKTNRGTWVDPISEHKGELEHVMMNGEQFRIVEIRPLREGSKKGLEVILEER